MMMQDILKYLKIIRKWWWVIALLFGATVGTMLALLFLTRTAYEAVVTAQVSAPPPQEVPLYSSYGREAIRDEINQTRSSFSELVLEGDVPYRALEALPDIQMSGVELREATTVELPDNSQLMRIKVRAPDPGMAALLANTVIEAGLHRYGALQAQPTVNTRQFIEGELLVAQAELEAAEAALAQFKIANKIGPLNSAITSQYDAIRNLRTQRDLARAEADVIRVPLLEEIILEREVELQNLIGLSAEYNQLGDQVERARSTYNFLYDKKTEAQIKENQILELGSIQIITPAFPPQNPVAAIDSRFVVLGAVASALAGMLLTFLLEGLEVSAAFRKQEPPERSEATVSPNDAG